MSVAAGFDSSTLSWVKDEIDLALEQAGEALARHAAAPADTGPLADARRFLHQACGALTIVGLAGISFFAEAIEIRLTRLAESPDSTTDAVAIDSAAGSALAALRRYLDDLMAGQPDQPLRLFPAYRSLLLAASEPEPTPAVLFYPDLAQRPPRREEVPNPLAPARAKALCLGFARGLAKWRGGEARGLVEMRNAVANVEQSLAQPAERALWWVAVAWLDTCASGTAGNSGVIAAADTLITEVLLDLDGQFKALAEGRNDNAPETLMKRMLYGIAIAPAGDALRESVRAAYRLAEQIPDATTAVATHREACRAPLATAMAEWENFSQGTAIALMRFHDVAQLLAASARESHDAELSRLVDAIADFAAWLRQQPERTDVRMALEVAGALVLVDDAIEQEGQRSPVDAPLFADEVTAEIARLDAIKHSVDLPPPAPRRWREHLLVGQVGHEILANIEAIEPVLDSFFQSPDAMSARGELAHATAKLRQVAGAFRLLDELLAAQLTEATLSRLTLCQNGQGSADDFAALAEQLAVLGQFTASLNRNRPERTLLEPFANITPEGEPAGAAEMPLAPPQTPQASDQEMLGIFTEEAHEVLAALAAAQPTLTANPADRDALTALRRGFHTLKGSGRMVGLNDLGEAAFAVEKLLNRWLDEHRAANEALLGLVDGAQTLFGQWVASIEHQQPAPDPALLVAQCAALREDKPLPTMVPAVPHSGHSILPEPTFSAAPTLTLVKPAPAPTAPPQPEPIVIGEAMISPALYALYVEEANSHIATLRREFSGASGIPSRELIRAAHTLAGISAGTGFPTVQALAHALESALVRHSLGQIAPDETTRMLLARAVGALEGMVGAIAERRAPAAESSLAETLEKLQANAAPSGSANSAPAVSPLAERRLSRPADEVDPQLAALFIEEADEHLHQLDADLRAWRTTPMDAGIGRRLARLLHTFKGGARMCGAMGIGELAHSMETRVEQALAAGGADLGVLDGLDTSLDRANHLIGQLRSKPAAPAATEPSQAALAPVSTTAATSTELSPAVLLRVRADLIDQLVNEAGEIAISRGRVDSDIKQIRAGLLDLTESVARLRSQLREVEIHAETRMQSRLAGSEAKRRDFDPLEFDRFTRLQELTRMMAESVNDVATVQHSLLRQVDDAGEALVSQSRQNRELSHALLRARMVPFTTVAERLHRIVRQTAKELGCQANLDIRGAETPVDRSVLERMLAPLEHLLRNAVAHGIEAPAQRLAAGKPELGQITLTIAPTDNDITLTLADDGKGLDYAAIHRRALEGGLIAADQEVGAAELAELIFRPGFSTASAVSEISGRGVGLDVVRDEVTRLGGQVAVSGQGEDSGPGTRFEIILPLTLAVIPVMLVRAAGQAWAIPAAMVEEARELGAEEAASRRTAGGVTRSGRHYDWHTLAELYGLAQPAGQGGWQLLLKSGGDQIALEVEALTQNQEVVVKPVGDLLARVPGLTGATVLPDGSVALIVNPVALALRTRQALTQTTLRPGAAPLPQFIPPVPIVQGPSVMVVDDSLTVRKITSRLLERAGYRVILAKDGIDALEQLANQLPAVILADIEMPRMDGFELVRKLRDDPRLATLPVIMITSRIADKHRQVARELGVRHYLGKPYDEDALLGLIADLCKP